MDETVRQPTTLSISSDLSHTDVDDAAYFSELSSNGDLQMLAEENDSSQPPASASMEQSSHHLDAEGFNVVWASNSASILNNPSGARTPSTKRDTIGVGAWKTIATITGSLLAALLSAIGHYLLSKNLHGKPVETSYLTQPQVSAVSILLTTIYKAALTASMGTCFAQHLWFLLRGSAMSLSAIEKLFVIRTNILAFGDLRGVWKAPMLFLMALLIWCLGLATIYPPGALVVTLQAHTFTERHNMSIMNPPPAQNMDSNGEFTLDTLGAIFMSPSSVFGETLSTGQDYTAFESYYYGGPSGALNNIVQSILFSDQIFTLPAPPGENSTYGLRFRGPKFRCTTKHYNDTIPLHYIPPVTAKKGTPTQDGGTTWLYDNGEWSNPPKPSLSAQVFLSTWDSERLVYLKEQRNIRNYAKYITPGNITEWKAFTAVETQICEPLSVLYNINVTFPRGIQNIEYTSNDLKPLMTNNYTNNEGPLIKDPETAEAHVLKEWYHELSIFLPLTNEWTFLDALGAKLKTSFYEYTQELYSDDCELERYMANGTAVYDCSWVGHYGNNETQKYGGLEGTVFQTLRFDQEDFFEGYLYNPRTSLNLTEDMLNNVLAKIIISAISLGMWWDMIPITTTRYRSTYMLTDPLNLILPYSICLAAAAIFAAVAIWSLLRNHMSAADGGFLQIMMATRGDTEMNRRILEERVAAIDHMSDELKSLRIRYGELVSEDILGVGGKRYGFGTTDETISLRKRR